LRNSERISEGIVVGGKIDTGRVKSKESVDENDKEIEA
jgi:hypothetical protein